jgi:hypothetical protein
LRQTPLRPIEASRAVERTNALVQSKNGQLRGPSVNSCKNSCLRTNGLGRVSTSGLSKAAEDFRQEQIAISTGWTIGEVLLRQKTKGRNTKQTLRLVLSRNGLCPKANGCGAGNRPI